MMCRVCVRVLSVNPHASTRVLARALYDAGPSSWAKQGQAGGRRTDDLD